MYANVCTFSDNAPVFCDNERTFCYVIWIRKGETDDHDGWKLFVAVQYNRTIHLFLADSMTCVKCHGLLANGYRTINGVLHNGICQRSMTNTDAFPSKMLLNLKIFI